MKKILEFLAKNNRWAIVLVIVLVLVGGGILRLQRNKINEWKGKHQTEVNLRNALIDTVRYYKNAYGEEVAEKLTIQESVKNLEKMYGQLTESQKELVSRVKQLNKDNTVITAALIEANVKIDSLLIRDGGEGDVVVDTVNKMTNFNNLRTADSTTNLIFDIDVNNILPAYPNIKPTMLIKNLDFPNKQLVVFEWKNEKKKGYPVSFSTTNSNPYYRTHNINSYAIPALSKEILDPTGWQKVGVWFKKNGRVVGFVAGGVVVGAGGTYLLMQ
jgi:LEA14-like dessication related protein